MSYLRRVSYHDAVPRTPSQDRRTRRTQARLHQAVLTLLETVPLERITVAEIARRADVNRATVYQHYPDVDALLADALTDEVRAVVGAVRECPFDGDDEVPSALTALFTHVGDRAPVFTRLLDQPGGFAVQLATALAEELTQRFADGQCPPAPAAVTERLHADFLAGGLVRILAGHAAKPHADAATTAQQTWQLLRGSNR